MLAGAPGLLWPPCSASALMRFLRPLAIGLLAALVPVSGLAQPIASRAVVATVEGDLEVTAGDLDARAERILYRGVFDRSQRYRIALQEATLHYLKGLDLFRLGYDEDPAFEASLGPRLTEEILIRYYERTYEEPFLNEASIREQHQAMGRVVAYRQIVLPKPPGASPAVLADLRSTVEEIRRQLDAGVSAVTLVERYSEDESSVARGGLMPPVTWQQSTMSPLNAVAFRLDPGESVSLETRDAFIVAVGDQIGERPTPPLAAVYDQIVEVLRGRYTERASEEYYEERQALVDSASVRWNRDVLAEIVEWAQTPGFFEGDYAETVDAYLDEHGDVLVFTDSAGELRLRELPRLLSEVLTVSASAPSRDEPFVQDFLLEAVRADRMVALAAELGLRDELLQPRTSSVVLASAFAAYYDQKRIEARLPDPTEDALRAFYEAYADSMFYQLETVYTDVIERDTEAEIDAVWAQLQAGVPFEDASNRRLRRSFERTRDGEIEARYIQEAPYLGAVAFSLEEGEMAEPVAYDRPEGRRYAIVRASRRLPERQLAFDEVRDRVLDAYTQSHRQRLAAEVEAELRDRYTVEVDDALWSRILGASQ